MASFLDSLRKTITKGEGAEDKAKKPSVDIVYAPSNKKRPSWSQFKYLFHVFSKKERVLFLSLAGVAVLAAGIGFGRLYFTNTQAQPVVGGDYVEAMVGQPQYINPLLSAASDVDSDLEHLVFSRLFSYGANRELQKDLVTDYQVSEDGKEYTLVLRQDVYFTDGEQLNADDVLFTISAIQDPAFKSPLYSSMQDVEIERVDDFTIKLRLAEPYAPFLSSLTFGILPEHIWFDIPPGNVSLAETNLKPIGSGPFKFASLKKDKTGNIRSYTLVRNDGYYDEPPLLEEVTFVMYADAYSAMAAAAENKVEGVSFVPPDELNKLADKNGKLQMHNLRLPQYVAVFFNQEKSDALADDAVREALARTIDKNKIVNEILRGQGEAINGPILPGYLGYAEDLTTYEQNHEKARAVLKDGGWKKEDDKAFRTNGETELKFTLTTVDIPEYKATAEYLKEQWAQIGAEVEIRVVSPNEVQSTIIKDRDYEALLFGNIIGTDPDPYPFWHSSQMESSGLALSIFGNEDIDGLLEEARQTTDEEARVEKYQEFQRILADELPAIFLYNPFYTYAVSKKVEGLGTMYVSAPADRFANITDWYVKRDRVWVGDDSEEQTEEDEAIELPEEQPAEEQPAEEETTEGTEEETGGDDESTDEETTEEDANDESTEESTEGEASEEETGEETTE